jgi:hypothetical protein
MDKAARVHSSRQWPWPARLIAVLAVLAGAAAALPAVWRTEPREPLRYACWFWHRPFQLTQSEARRLREARIDRLYVYSGTLVAWHGALRMTRAQAWRSQPPIPVYPVIRVHPAANAALLSPAGAAQAASLVRDDPRLRRAPGVQWDADIPTAQLAEYAAFLHRFRRALAPGQALSVTALPDWLRARSYAAVCDAVDEVAPQFYGNEWPEPGRRPPPLWETSRLLAAVRASRRGRARVWVGLPAYGRCVVMDARWQPLGMRHDLDPEALLEDPAWELVVAGTRRETWDGAATRVEDTLALRCREETTAGPMPAPAGTQLWFQWPRIEGLEAAVARIRALSLPGVAGVCFFRWPAPGEPLAFPSGGLAPLSSGKPGVSAGQDLQIRLERAGGTVRVTVRNQGLDPPPLPEGLTLEVTPLREATVLADEPVFWQEGAQPASARRGDRAVFTRPLLRPGRRWEVCRVANCAGPVAVVARWRVGDGRWRTLTARDPGLARTSAEGIEGGGR